MRHKWEIILKEHAAVSSQAKEQSAISIQPQAAFYDHPLGSMQSILSTSSTFSRKNTRRPLNFKRKSGRVLLMAQTPYKDELNTATREGYEARGAFGPPRVQTREPGSPILRVVGGACIVGGMFWAVYLVTRSSDILSTLEQDHGPLGITALGVIVSILGKSLRL